MLDWLGNVEFRHTVYVANMRILTHTRRKKKRSKGKTKISKSYPTANFHHWKYAKKQKNKKQKDQRIKIQIIGKWNHLQRTRRKYKNKWN